VGDFSLVGECFSEKRKFNFLGVSDCQIWKKKEKKKESPDSKSGSSR